MASIAPRPPDSLGALLQRLRQRREWSQPLVSEKAEVSETYYASPFD